MKTGKADEWTYVLRRDRDLPESERTEFKLRPLTTAEYFAVISKESESGLGLGMWTRLCFGLVGWSNLRGDDVEGELIPFLVDEDGQVKTELLDLIAAAPGGGPAMIELSVAIQNHSTWEPDAEKNSDSPDSSSQES